MDNINLSKVKKYVINKLSQGIKWFIKKRAKLPNDVNGDNDMVNDWKDIDVYSHHLSLYAIDGNHLICDCLNNTLNGDVDSGYNMQAFFLENLNDKRNNFNDVIKLMTGGSKILDPKALYVCDFEDPSDVNSMNRGNFRAVLDDMIKDCKYNIKAWKSAPDSQVKEYVRESPKSFVKAVE